MRSYILMWLCTVISLLQVRNSSTLLFSTLITRIFGVKRGKDEHSKKNKYDTVQFVLYAFFLVAYCWLLLRLRLHYSFTAQVTSFSFFFFSSSLGRICLAWPFIFVRASALYLSLTWMHMSSNALYAHWDITSIREMDRIPKIFLSR